jgi:hypothetical protein
VAGSRIARMTTPQKPSVQCALAPMVNSVGMTTFLPVARHQRLAACRTGPGAVITRRG